MRCLVFVGLILCASFEATADDNWPQFRGHHSSGIGSGHPPARWDVTSGNNIEWKTKIDGLGHSAPVVWGDRVFLTTAISDQTDTPVLRTGRVGGNGESADEKGDWKWAVLSIDLNSGEIDWTREVAQGVPGIKRHIKASHANCTAATNGQFVVAFFGSEGLYCLDMAGNVVWKKDFGRLHSGPYDAPKLEWGFASSPVIHNDKVVVQCDCLNTAFIMILDLATGEEIRRIKRDDVATWSTPLIVSTEEGTQIVANGYRSMAGYDIESGERLWFLKNGGDVPVPTPLFANGLILLTNGHGRTPTYAVLPSAQGELTPTRGGDELPSGLKWWQPRDGSYIPTPLVKDDLLYTCNDSGRLTVRNALTGTLVYRARMNSGTDTFTASAVASGDHLYFSGESGEVHVVQTGREFKLIARNQMNDSIMATPAITKDRLLIRTARHLFCIRPDTTQ